MDRQTDGFGIDIYLELRLLFLRPGFPLIDNFPPETPQVLLGVFLETHATRGDGNLGGLRGSPRMATLARQRIERLCVRFDQPA